MAKRKFTRVSIPSRDLDVAEQIGRKSFRRKIPGNMLSDDLSEETPEVAARRREFFEQLDKTLGNEEIITKTQREAFELHFLEGKSYAGVGTELGISMSAAEQRIKRAVWNLKNKGSLDVEELMYLVSKRR